jgi:hypothetical protein
MSAFSESQVVAFLFKRGARVEVAVEGPEKASCFELENSLDGLSKLEVQLMSHRNGQPPFFCICMAPDAQFEGVWFEELHGAPIPKLIFPLAKLEAFARREGRSAQRAETLLRAYRADFPRGASAV